MTKEGFKTDITFKKIDLNETQKFLIIINFGPKEKCV